MNSGHDVIKELGKHGLRGYYFSYKQYTTLSKIKDFSEVKEKITEWGYPNVKNANDVVEVVNLLIESDAGGRTEKGCLTAMLLEPLLWIILLFFSGC